MKRKINLKINGKSFTGEVEPRMLLIHYLREVAGFTGPHIGCETSICGACTEGASKKGFSMINDVRCIFDWAPEKRGMVLVCVAHKHPKNHAPVIYTLLDPLPEMLAKGLLSGQALIDAEARQVLQPRPMLLALWLEHCKQAGHVTQAEALEQGKDYNPEKYASYSLSPSMQRIYCALPGCLWKNEEPPK